MYSTLHTQIYVSGYVWHIHTYKWSTCARCCWNTSIIMLIQTACLYSIRTRPMYDQTIGTTHTFCCCIPISVGSQFWYSLRFYVPMCAMFESISEIVIKYSHIYRRYIFSNVTRSKRTYYVHNSQLLMPNIFVCAHLDRSEMRLTVYGEDVTMWLYHYYSILRYSYIIHT